MRSRKQGETTLKQEINSLERWSGTYVILICNVFGRFFIIPSPVWGFWPPWKSGKKFHTRLRTTESVSKPSSIQRVLPPHWCSACLRRGVTLRVTGLDLGESEGHTELASVNQPRRGWVKKCCSIARRTVTVQLDLGSSFMELASKKSLEVLYTVTESLHGFTGLHLSSAILTFIKPQWLLAWFSILKKKKMCFTYPVLWASWK